MELDIRFLANVTGESSTAERFTRASKARQTAMNSVFWNEQMGQWIDYWINTNSTSQVVVILKICHHVGQPFCTILFIFNFLLVGCLQMGGF